MKFNKLLKILSEDISDKILDTIINPIYKNNEIQSLLNKYNLKLNNKNIIDFSKSLINNIISENIDDTTLVGLGHIDDKQVQTSQLTNNHSMLDELHFSNNKEDHLKHLEELLSKVNEKLEHMTFKDPSYDAWYMLKMITKKSVNNLKNNKESISTIYFDMPESLLDKIKRWFGFKSNNMFKPITPTLKRV